MEKKGEKERGRSKKGVEKKKRIRRELNSAINITYCQMSYLYLPVPSGIL